ncbi:hypothetical protein CWB72_02325 [Pseudoalteromonas phenolica]|nr:hypothetical protein CWB72_02325 [Pseudoalteromonas phenolica]
MCAFMYKKFVLFLLIYACLLPLKATAQVLTACIDDHPPYQVLGETPSGTHIDALRTLAKVLNKEIKFIQSPNFPRCVAFLESGEADVIAGLNPTEERQKFAFFAPFKKADALRVISKNGIMINTYNDFKNKLIGVSRGALYFPKFDKDVDLDKIEIQNVRIGFSLLLKDRIDLIMVSPAMLKTFSAEIEQANLIVSPIALEEMRNKETFFGISKMHKLKLKQTDILSKINQAYISKRFDNPP